MLQNSPSLPATPPKQPVPPSAPSPRPTCSSGHSQPPHAPRPAQCPHSLPTYPACAAQTCPAGLVTSAAQAYCPTAHRLFSHNPGCHWPPICSQHTCSQSNCPIDANNSCDLALQIDTVRKEVQEVKNAILALQCNQQSVDQNLPVPSTDPTNAGPSEVFPKESNLDAKPQSFPNHDVSIASVEEFIPDLDNQLNSNVPTNQLL